MGIRCFTFRDQKQTKIQTSAENEKQDKMKHKSVSVFGAQLAVCSAVTFVHKTQINRSHNSQINRNPQHSHQLSHHQSPLFLKDFTSKNHLILKVMKITSRQVEISTIAIRGRVICRN